MIFARYAGLPGEENRLIGFTKEDLAMLVKSEVLLLLGDGVRTILVYADDAATLEASVRLASQLLEAELSAAKGEHQC